ncbi:MAG: hypothetical protein QXY45_03490 [Candidatus Aenigmatarchaeota archaeon]
MSDDSTPLIKRHTIEQGVSEYGGIKDQFETMFFELEKIEPLNFGGIYLILPEKTKIKKKSILWAFSLAKKCNSTVFVSMKKNKQLIDEIEKVSKALNVKYEILEDDPKIIMEEVKKENVIVILPRDVVEPLKDEENEGPILII